LDERERSFELVSPAPTIWRPEVGATRPTRSADGAVGGPVDTAPVLSVELCLPGSGGGVASRDAMSELTEATGNARWLSSRCPRCIADGSARRTSGSAGRFASSRLGDSQRRVCLGRGRSAAFASLHPSGQFRLTSMGRARTCHSPSPVSIAQRRPGRGRGCDRSGTARLQSRSHNDDQVEVEAATEAVQHENEHQRASPLSSLHR
jgi:hypothetical protein